MSLECVLLLALAGGVCLVRGLLLAGEAAVARVSLPRARALAEVSASGRPLLALKAARESRLALVGLAGELLLLGAALLAAAAAGGSKPMPRLLSVVSGLLMAGFALELELVLRALAQARPERWAVALTGWLRWTMGALQPWWSLWVGLSHRLSRPLGGHRPERAEPMPSLEDLEAHLSAEAAQGRVGKADPQLLRSLLDFSEKTAREVMIPRTRVVALDLLAPVSEVVRVISEEGHTRVPVYRDTLDDLVGILHSRDLVPLLANPDLIRLPDLIRPVFFVPWSKRVGAVLREMQRRHSHIAAVVDEYGGVMGMITLEDILAEIVGEIGGDAGAAEEGPLVDRLADGSVLVRGGISREDFAKAFGVELPGNDAETLAGWLNQRAGAIPELGDRFQLEPALALQVVERSPSRVQRVRVMRADRADVGARARAAS